MIVKNSGLEMINVNFPVNMRVVVLKLYPACRCCWLKPSKVVIEATQISWQNRLNKRSTMLGIKT